MDSGKRASGRTTAAALAVAAACAMAARAAEEGPRGEGGGETGQIVVTATRLATPIEQVPGSLGVVGGALVRQRGDRTALDAIRASPGVETYQTGGPGQQSAIFLRGSNPEHVLLLVDGVEVNDPLSPGRSAEAALLSLDGIDRIEILRGPQGPLYGSDAMGGVIQVFTKAPKAGRAAALEAEGGSYGTWRASASAQAAGERGDVSAGVQRFETDGFSAADEDLGNVEDDGHRASLLRARAVVRAAEELTLTGWVRGESDETDIDRGGGAGMDDPNYTVESARWFARAQGEGSLADGRWRQTLGVSFATHDRDVRDDPDPAHPADRVRGTYDAQLLKAEWQHDLALGNAHTLTLGVEWEEERGDSTYESASDFGVYASRFDDESAATLSGYAQDLIRVGERGTAAVGGRVDDHDRFGTEATWRAGATCAFAPGARVRAALGTGFKAPSLYQLYSEYGNPGLDPERSAAWEVGAEKDLLEGAVTLAATGFRQEYEDLIQFEESGEVARYFNTDEAVASGGEFSAAGRPAAGWTLTAHYTYLETEDRSTGEDLIRRPAHSVGADVGWQATAALTVSAGADYIGEREDLDFASFPAERVTLDAYTLVRAGASVAVADGVELFGRIENLFDEDYESVYGYGVAGRAFYAGARAEF
jgi:vitamin B12 transporter